MNGFHTFDPGRADELEETDRYRHLSVEELIGASAVSGDDVVVDLGSGTGFYTDDFAAVAERVYAIDVQPLMHRLYREKGLPPNVESIAADGGHVPLSDRVADVVVSTMTHHELPARTASEAARLLRPGGRIVVADWTADGPGEAGPPLDERFDTWWVASTLSDAGFEITRAESRRETLFVVGVR
ncbi:MAG: class I SAM-dependent methyltransferase [Natronomonas sp.]